MRTTVITQAGTRHEQNQDSHLIARPGPLLLAVADGMGGYQDGHVSSNAVTTALLQLTEHARLDEVLLNLHRQIQHRNESRGVRSGTTVALALVEGDTLTVKNIGDSRVLLIHGATEQVLTYEDTLVNELRQQGRLDPDGQNMPPRNVITQCIGLGSVPVVHTAVLQMPAGAAICVMSDGGYNLARPGEYCALIGQLRGGSTTAMQKFVDTLRSRGEQDDITLLAAY